MGEGYKLLIGKGEINTELLSKMSNRHGLIAGATGTGKTVTLKVMAEHFSSIGVPVFLADSLIYPWLKSTTSLLLDI